MKKIVWLMGILLTMEACEKIPINGKLDGRWQLMNIEYPNGTSESPERTYYSVQLHMINLYKVGGANLYGTFAHEDDSLHIVMRQTVKEAVKSFGINDTIVSLGVETLTSNRMILSGSYARLSFRKF
jgi:hypothetical protein